MTCSKQQDTTEEWEGERPHNSSAPGDRVHTYGYISVPEVHQTLLVQKSTYTKEECVFMRNKISILPASFPGSHSVHESLGMWLLSYVPGQGQCTHLVWCSPPGELVYLDTRGVFHECQHEPQSPVFCENLHLSDCASHTPEELERTVLRRRNRTNH